jgi:YYY domain-containing protein
MQPNDIIAVTQWWATLFLIGLLFLPLTNFLFDRFIDKGYLFSKILGAALTTFVIYIFGVVHVIPFSQINSYGLLAVTAGTTILLLPKKWKILYYFKKYWLVFLLEEILFAVALFAWAYVHSFQPDIHGLEKYMDYGFINSALRSRYMPPMDMWLPPYPINYYYFGHIMTAVIIKLSTVKANIGFNLMLSTIFALCFTETFSIGANLYASLRRKTGTPKIRIIASGILTSLLVTFSGNLHILYAFFKPYQNESPVPIWTLQFNPIGFFTENANSYWYPNATRFIYHTIHEFPIYSWVVADLHGHVLDIPMVLFTIALLLSLFFSQDPEILAEEKEEKEEAKQKEKKHSAFARYFLDFSQGMVVHPLWLLMIGFVLSVMYMTNAWDGAIYLLLTAFLLIFLHWNTREEYKKIYTPKDEVTVIKDSEDSQKASVATQMKWFLPICRDIVLTIVMAAAAFVLFSMPYSLIFRPFASGIGILCAPDFLTKLGHLGPFLFEPTHCQKSHWWELLMLYGFFYFFVFSFLIFLYRAKRTMYTDYFILILIILSTLLIVLPEFIYLKDIYPDHYRANTMFKLVFQAFMMLSICSSYIVIRLIRAIRFTSWYSPFIMVLFPAVSILLIALVLTYPYLAINSYYGNLKMYKGLDGTAYLSTTYPSDADAINWLNLNIQGQPVVLEAQGDSYTDYERVSANTGLPTVLGWTVHEWLWRGSYDVPPGLSPKQTAELSMYYPAPRIEDVKNIYESADLVYTKQLLKKYYVEYVFVGTMEFQKYPQLNQNKFNQLGHIVFQEGVTKIYQINQ